MSEYNRFKPGQSGNPAGRPPGSISLTTKLRNALEPEFQNIVNRLIREALSGDTQVAMFLISQVIPRPKPSYEPIEIEIVGNTLAEKADSILDLIGKGKISVQDGKAMLESLAILSRISEVQDLVAKLEEVRQTLGLK